MKQDKAIYEVSTGDTKSRKDRMKGLKKGGLSKILDKFKK